MLSFFDRATSGTFFGSSTSRAADRGRLSALERQRDEEIGFAQGTGLACARGKAQRKAGSLAYLGDILARHERRGPRMVRVDERGAI